jgi:two-component system CheB/CheR fusion protein
MVSTECEVRDQQGIRYSLRIRPYKNVENRIDGAVLALFDIDQAKRAEDEIRVARDFAQALQDSMPEPMVVVDRKLHVHSANRAFREMFGLSQGQAQGKDLFDLPMPGWDLRELRGQIEPLIRTGAEIPLLAVHGRGEQPLTIRSRRVDIHDAQQFTVLTFQGPPRTGD